MNKDIWLTATHIAGVDNVEADRESRNFDDKTEEQLCPKTFKDLVSVLGAPKIDMIASHINFQMKPFSWRADPEASAVNVMDK